MIDDFEAGATLYDENGEVFAIKQYQQRENIPTGREVVAAAASKVNAGKWDDGEKDAQNGFAAAKQTQIMSGLSVLYLLRFVYILSVCEISV